jgi:uncharacterized protein YdaU (DUF1376 family)
LPTDKLRGELFWVDRWMASSAFLLAAEPRGVYREMLSQAWLRGARLPNNHDEIRRAAGLSEAEWSRCWPVIGKFWRVEGEYLVNDTQAEVYADTLARATRRSDVGRMGAAARHGAPADDKPDKPRQTIPGEKSWKFSSLYVSPKMHKVVIDALGPRAAGLDFDKIYNDIALSYLERGQPADVLTDLKRQVLTGARSSREVGPPSVDESAARRARMEAERKSLSDEEKAQIKAMFKGSR